MLSYVVKCYLVMFRVALYYLLLTYVVWCCFMLSFVACFVLFCIVVSFVACLTVLLRCHSIVVSVFCLMRPLCCPVVGCCPALSRYKRTTQSNSNGCVVFRCHYLSRITVGYTHHENIVWKSRIQCNFHFILIFNLIMSLISERVLELFVKFLSMLSCRWSR